MEFKLLSITYVQLFAVNLIRTQGCFKVSYQVSSQLDICAPFGGSELQTR